MKWEYLTRSYILSLGGEISEVSKNDMNYLGAKGWELVSSNIIQKGYEFYLICLFKKSYE